MPNHVTTKCTVTGPTSDVAAFVERHIRTEENETRFDFDTIIPQPPDVNASLESDSGFPTPLWYEWRCQHWGTKWGAYRYQETERGDGCFAFRFETAWSVPEPVFRKLEELHPSLTFTVASHDEGSCFVAYGHFGQPPSLDLSAKAAATVTALVTPFTIVDHPGHDDAAACAEFKKLEHLVYVEAHGEPYPDEDVDEES